MLGFRNLHFRSALWGFCDANLSSHVENTTLDGGLSVLTLVEARAVASAQLPSNGACVGSLSREAAQLRGARLFQSEPGVLRVRILERRAAGGGRKGAGQREACENQPRSAREVEPPEVAVVNLSLGLLPLCPPLQFVHPPRVLESAQFQQFFALGLFEPLRFEAAPGVLGVQCGPRESSEVTRECGVLKANDLGGGLLRGKLRRAPS